MQSSAQQHPAYGYRPVTALLRRQGWQVNPKRIHRLCGSRRGCSSGDADTSSAASVRPLSGYSVRPVRIRSGATTSSA
ncbi:MAG: IS3 family transposase [Pleurocapsa minor GSE-CHR-MK-17-07R]|nr:IS3 family transposase [Pleurocapsa minor GSE-CHR-MK 17-07R]